MAEDSNIHHRQKPPQPPLIRPGKLAGGGGEIVEVQGGHIVRSTGRKDRHSKVCTAKGPRDRRVRLSAHTAIQFYDVQDRLGYDRPSKAVDWLINKAKAAIDELAELPPWDPAQMMLAAAAAKPKRNRKQEQQQEQEEAAAQNRNRFDFDGGGGEDDRSGFLMPSLDTIKSFSSTGGACVTSAAETSEAVLQSYHNHHDHRQQQNQSDLLAGTGSHSQDLRLSLHSFQDPPQPMILHHHESPVLFGAPTNQLGFDEAAATSSDGWENQQPAHHRLVGWSGGGDGGGGTSDTSGGGVSAGGFMFSSPANPYQPIFGQNQLFSTQRGTLQSSNSLSFRAWIDHHHHQQQPITAIATAEDLTHHHHHHHHNHHLYHVPSPAVFQSAIPGIRFSGEFSGFRIPARFQGEVVEEEHDGGVPNKPPSSVSSVSRH